MKGKEDGEGKVGRGRKREKKRWQGKDEGKWEGRERTKKKKEGGGKE